MWRLYGRGDAPIAIVSSVSAVMSDSNVFCETTDFGGMFGDVIYDSFFLDGRFRASTLGLPFGRPSPPGLTSALAFFCKPKAFAYEKEWRLLLWKRAAGCSSVSVPIADPKKFIERVLVSPDAPDWILDTVKELVQVQFGLEGMIVEKSSLAGHLRGV